MIVMQHSLIKCCRVSIEERKKTAFLKQSPGFHISLYLIFIFNLSDLVSLVRQLSHVQRVENSVTHSFFHSWIIIQSCQLIISLIDLGVWKLSQTRNLFRLNLSQTRNLFRFLFWNVSHSRIPISRDWKQMFPAAIDTFPLILVCFLQFCFFFPFNLISDGIRLPDNHRQVVHSNGTLVMKEVVRESDEGHYTCTASNKRGASSRSGINIIIRGKGSNHFLFFFLSFFTIQLSLSLFLSFFLIQQTVQQHTITQRRLDMTYNVLAILILCLLFLLPSLFSPFSLPGINISNLLQEMCRMNSKIFVVVFSCQGGNWAKALWLHIGTCKADGVKGQTGEKRKERRGRRGEEGEERDALKLIAFN